MWQKTGKLGASTSGYNEFQEIADEVYPLGYKRKPILGIFIKSLVCDMWVTIILLIVALLVLTAVWYYVAATKKLNQIVLIEESRDLQTSKPKVIPRTGNPIVSFPKFIYQAVVEKKTDFERFLTLLDKFGPLKTQTCTLTLCALFHAFLIPFL